MAGSALKLGRPATYEDLLAVPEHLVAEIFDGDLHTSPRPSYPHAFTAGMIYRLESGRWVVALTCGGDDKVRAEPFEASQVDLAAWWPPLAEPSPPTR